MWPGLCPDDCKSLHTPIIDNNIVEAVKISCSGYLVLSIIVGFRVGINHFLYADSTSTKACSLHGQWGRYHLYIHTYDGLVYASF